MEARINQHHNKIKNKDKEIDRVMTINSPQVSY